MSRVAAVLLAGLVAGCSSSSPIARGTGPVAPGDCSVTRPSDVTGINVEAGAVLGGSGVWACSSTLAFAATGGISQFDGSRWVATVLGFDSSATSAIWGSSGHDIWAVGNHGLVVHFDGTSWHPQHLSFASQLTAVWGSGASDVYAVGTDNTQLPAIFHFNGTAWSEIRQVGGSYALLGIGGSGPNDVWAVGDGPGNSVGIFIIHGSASAGFTKDPISGSMAGTLCGVWADSANDVWAVGDNVALHHTSTGWTPVSTGERLRSVWGRSSAEVYMGAQSGAILKYGGGGLGYQISPGSGGSINGISGVAGLIVAAGGSSLFQNTSGSWTQNQPGSIVAIWLSDDTHGWAVGDAGRIVQGTGSAWTDVTPVSSAALTAVWGSGTDNVYAVGANATVLRNSGGSWGPVTTSASDSLNAVWGSGDGDVWIAGANGQILHGSGTTFSAMSSGTTQHLRGVSGTGPSDVWAVGDGGTVLHYNGSAWSPVPSGVTVPLVAIWMNSPTDGWAVGPVNGPASCIFTSCSTTPEYLHWDGTTWSSFPVDFGMPLALWFQSPTKGWSAGSTLLQYNGTTFVTPSFNGIGYGIRGVYGTADGNVYFVGGAGSIFRLQP